MNAVAASAKLKELQAKLSAYDYAMGAIYYDAATAAPAGGEKERGEALGYLSGVYYEMFADPQVLEWINAILTEPDAVDAVTLKNAEVLKREFDEMVKIPQEEYVAFSKLTSESSAVWHQAKKNNDFASFSPFIDKIVDARVRFAGYIDPEKKPYDVSLSAHEKGLSMEELDRFFAGLREKIVPLLKKVQEMPQVDDSFLQKSYPVEKQKEFSYYLMDVLAIDKEHCALGETEHPFTMNFSKHDVRMTTHFYEEHPEFGIYSTVHEGGHALYELHTGDDLIGTALATGSSMGIHESQSRLFENMIGRSRAFIEYIFPKMTEIFPEQLEGVTAEQMYRALNKCEPSLIRTEADELTYCLHVMVRYEIEKKLYTGEIKADDLPRVWQEMMNEYLGIDVPDDTRGVLQDSHWSNAQFGYFPSYAIGSAYAAQITAAMKKDLDYDECVRKGDMAPVHAWLEDRIWKHGRGKDPSELIELACGEPFDPAYYLDYLEEKFSEIYGLK